MDFKFSKDSGDTQQEGDGDKKKQSTLLVLLLILVGGFTYLYFFTGLIKPQEASKTTEAPVVAPQVEKMPLPPREGEAAKPDVTTPEKAELPKAADTSPVAAAVPAARPAAAPAAPAAKPPAKEASATFPIPSKPKNESNKNETAKPADKKPQPPPTSDIKGDKASTIKAEEKKSAPEAKKSDVVEKMSRAPKGTVMKTNSVGQAKPKADVKTQKTATNTWSLEVGNYVLEAVLSADMGRVRKAGFEPIVKPSIRKKTKMNRLFVSDFKDRATAQSILEKLKRHTSDAFVLEQDGRYAVYSGSYIQGESARSEKERLKTAGFSTTVRHSVIEIPSQSLTIGPLSSKKAVDAALAKLKSAGIKASLSQK